MRETTRTRTSLNLGLSLSRMNFFNTLTYTSLNLYDSSPAHIRCPYKCQRASWPAAASIRLLQHDEAHDRHSDASVLHEASIRRQRAIAAPYHVHRNDEGACQADPLRLRALPFRQCILLRHSPRRVFPAGRPNVVHRADHIRESSAPSTRSDNNQSQPQDLRFPSL